MARAYVVPVSGGYQVWGTEDEVNHWPWDDAVFSDLDTAQRHLNDVMGWPNPPPIAKTPPAEKRTGPPAGSNPYANVPPQQLVGGQQYSEKMEQAKLDWARMLAYMEQTGLVPPGFLSEFGGTPGGGGSGGGGGGGGGGGATGDAALLDFIAAQRPDIKSFLQSNGWDMSTPEKVRAGIQHWWSNMNPPERGSNGDLAAYARSLGYQGASSAADSALTGARGDSSLTGLMGAPEDEAGPGRGSGTGTATGAPFVQQWPGQRKDVTYSYNYGGGPLRDDMTEDEILEWIYAARPDIGQVYDRLDREGGWAPRSPLQRMQDWWGTHPQAGAGGKVSGDIPSGWTPRQYAERLQERMGAPPSARGSGPGQTPGPQATPTMGAPAAMPESGLSGGTAVPYNDMFMTGAPDDAGSPTGDIPPWGTIGDYDPRDPRKTLDFRRLLQDIFNQNRNYGLQQGAQNFYQQQVFPWDQEKFRQQFGENRRQFDIGTLASKSGPRDWVQHQILQTGIDPSTFGGSMADAFSRQSPFRATQGSDSWEMALQRYLQQNPRGGTPGLQGVPSTGQITDALGAPAQQNESMAYTGAPQRYPWEGQSAAALDIPNSTGQAGLAQRDRAQGQGAAPVAVPTAQSPNAPWWQNAPVTQGHQITAQGYNRWDPSQKAMQESLWSAQGKVPEDEWSRMRKSWLSAGPVSGSTRYRMTG